MTVPLLLITLLSLTVFIILLKIILSVLTILFTFPPSISSARRMILDVKNEIKMSKPGKKIFYDLGSGSGRVCLSVAREFPGLKVKGIEIFKPVYLLSKLKQLLGKQSNLELVNHDFFKVNLSDADFIFVFLTKAFLSKLAAKVKKEAPAGCLIFSNNFPIDQLTLYKKIDYPDLFTKRHLYIYKL